MTVQEPLYFGWEGIVRWGGQKFPVDPENGKYEPTNQEKLDWISTNSARTDQPISINVAVQRNIIEMTPRGHAIRGYRTVFQQPALITVNFRFFHDRSDTTFSKFVVEAMFNMQDIGMAFFSSTREDEGIIGNWQMNGNKDEPLRNMQVWSFSCVPSDYVEYGVFV